LNASDAITFFKRQYGYTPTHLAQAPGRLELLGNHTDYNLGLVLGLAIDRYVWMASSPRTDGKVTLVSSAFGGAKEQFSLTAFEKNSRAPWTDYVKGVLLQLRRHQASLRGFDAAITSTIPMGSGLSSSAALEVCTALTMRQICPYTLTDNACTTPPERDDNGMLPPLTASEKLRIARLCQAAENDFVGVNSGLLDQICSLFGKEFHAIEIDCMSLAIEHVPMIGEIAIVVCHTGAERKLTSGEYNELRRLCESAAAKLGVSALRKVDMPMLLANKDRLTMREFECAYHVVGEIQRVIFGSRALRENDFEQFGQYMLQSHESSRDYFKNSTPELDLLVELARLVDGCLGARLTGGGFGGATINLVQRDAAERFMTAVDNEYHRRSGKHADPMLCKVVDGARVVPK
jgi:galactokinase